MSAGRPRLVLHERDEAEEVVDRLAGEGHHARVERERFQGEDDDEDHFWAVVSDVPRRRLEELAEEYDGWVDAGEPVPSTPPRLPPLPQAPRRRKRPPAD